MILKNLPILLLTFLLTMSIGCKGDDGSDGAPGTPGVPSNILEFIDTLEAGDSVKQFANIGSRDVVLPYWELTTDAWLLLADLASDPSTDTWATVDYTLDQVSFFNIPFPTRYKVLIIDDPTSSGFTASSRFKF